MVERQKERRALLLPSVDASGTPGRGERRERKPRRPLLAVVAGRRLWARPTASAAVLQAHSARCLPNESQMKRSSVPGANF